MPSEVKLERLESEARRKVSTRTERQRFRERAIGFWHDLSRTAVEEEWARERLRGTAFRPDSEPPSEWIDAFVHTYLALGEGAALASGARLWDERWRV